MNTDRGLTNSLGLAIVVLLVLNLVAPRLYGEKPSASPVAPERKAVALTVADQRGQVYRLWSDGTVEWMRVSGSPRKWIPLDEVP